MSSDNAWLLMRADARGLSGILTASTPTDLRNRAPSTSLRMSIPFGGTISTMVTNSPRASLAPTKERLSRAEAGTAIGVTWFPAALGVGPLPRCGREKREEEG